MTFAPVGQKLEDNRKNFCSTGAKVKNRTYWTGELMMNNDIAIKTLSFSVQSARMTSDILKNMLNDFLFRPQTFHKQKVTYGNMAKRGKLDSIEITENNIGDFVRTARKYDIDYALKRDRSTSPPTYHVFFSSGNAENFTKAFSEYAGVMQKKLDKRHNPLDRETVQEVSQAIQKQSAEQSKERHHSKSDIAGR